MSAPHTVPAQAFRGMTLDPHEERAKLGRGEALRLAALPHRRRSRFGLSQHLPNCRSPRRQAPGWWCGPPNPGASVMRYWGAKTLVRAITFASVLDDNTQGVTHVIRGEDLADAAGLHALLYALFGFEPPVYGHHRLIRDEAGRRLAKRDAAMTLRAMREAGVTPVGVRAMFGEGFAAAKCFWKTPELLGGASAPPSVPMGRRA